MKNPRILIVRTDRMGDVILSTPVIRVLRGVFPEAYLGMMVRPENRELVEGNPDLNAVLLYDKEGREKSWLGTLRFALELKKHRFETAVILHSTNRAILVTRLAGIRWRVGYARRLPWLLTGSYPYLKREGDRHEVEYNLALLRLMGLPMEEGIPLTKQPLFVPRNPKQEEKVDAFLHAHGVKEIAPLVLLHPGASCPSKRWPADRFAAVADRLIESRGAQVVVVTGPQEVFFGEEVIRLMKHPALRALGTLSLGELACLLGRAKCLISNDSGPVHLACAVGTPVAAVFGRWGGGLSPKRWGPTGEKSIVLHHDVGCRPCLAHRCTIGFVCLQAVSVEEVLAAAEHAAGLSRV
ncbi:MAG: lipopolysaccharide heptosyltransferase II [Candidatus Omnitrophica bacterium]|nr:lipopolysaccharide heptosyltransferase II [Candidatus Omnitrophota bacterium]